MLLIQLAFRNLFRNGRRTFLTCLLITSSLVVMILMDGLILGMLGPLNKRHVSVHICFKLLPFFEHCVRHEFDSDGDFKRKSRC